MGVVMSMYSVSPQTNSSIIRKFRAIEQKISQAGLDLIGGRSKVFTVTNPKVKKAIDWTGREISSPENRLILGITALMSQPFIDLHNKDVDQETRKYSVARTIAKIVVGTVTGVIIRKGCIKAIDAFTKLPSEITNPNDKLKKFRQILLPKIEKIEPEKLTQYKNTMGTLLALGVMLFTNFLIDAPLTKHMTNKLVGIKEGKDAKNS